MLEIRKGKVYSENAQKIISTKRGEMAQWVYSYSNVESDSVYIQDNHVYHGRTGQALYFIQNGWWYSMTGGKAEFYTQDKTVYEPNGKPAYYFSD